MAVTSPDTVRTVVPSDLEPAQLAGRKPDGLRIAV